MTKRQPTEREAAIAMQWVGTRWEWLHGLVASDISKRCHDCKTVLLDRRDGPGQYQYATTSRDNLWRTWRNSDERVDVCLSCYNRRKPEMLTANIWNDNRILAAKLKGMVNEQRKNNRPAS